MVSPKETRFHPSASTQQLFTVNFMFLKIITFVRVFVSDSESPEEVPEARNSHGGGKICLEDKCKATQIRKLHLYYDVNLFRRLDFTNTVSFPASCLSL